MKRILLSIVFMATVLWSVETVSGGRVAIWDVYTEPNQPTNRDSISIVVSGTGSSTPAWIDDYDFRREGNLLELDVFISLGPFLAVSEWSHSEIIGTRPAGSYDLIVRAYCDSELSDTHSTFFTVAPQGPTLLVPDDYPTIQAAIDAAFDGDTVLIADGIYTGPGNRDIDFKGKAITVRSESGPGNCIIDCKGTGDEAHRGFYFKNGEGVDSVLDGFTITNGSNGIYCYHSSPTITNCTISGNWAGWCGGIYCEWESSPTITNCTITDNISFWCGGIYCWESSPTITNCTISGNSARVCGGIYCEWESSPTITNCTITDNISFWDGGIYCGKRSSLTISNSAITNNTGGGIYCEFYSSLTISNSAITNNTVGGIGGGSSNLAITNCTISGNTEGGGVYCWYSNLTITNCILWGNEAIYKQQICLYDNTNAWVGYTDVQGGQDDVYIGSGCTLEWSAGNINVDPYFVEPNVSDYHLSEDSPCVDAGDPNYMAEPNETDLDGNPRVIGDYIDMGAYEFWLPIEAAMKFTPQMVNCNSKGNLVKAHLALPEGFLPEDVDVNEPAVAKPIGAESEYIKVLGAGPVRLEICFDREAFCDGLTETGEVEVAVIGSLTTGRYFYGSDTIRIKASR